MSRLAVTLALVTMVTWGLWASLAKVATRTVTPSLAVAVSFVGSIAVAVVYTAGGPETLRFTDRGLAIALLSGLFAGTGSVTFYAALSAGRSSIVTTVTALYFVVAALIGVFVFNEALRPRDAAAIGLAVVAVTLLAT